jgi:hypothetical protein
VNAVTLTIRDETTAGDVLAELALQLSETRLTVGELIRERIHQEVRSHNAESATGRRRYSGLVQPDDIERELNGDLSPAGRAIDAGRQTAVALEAFERGQLLVLIDDRQVTELEQPVTVGPQSTVVFLRLVPLVGG